MLMLVTWLLLALVNVELYLLRHSLWNLSMACFIGGMATAVAIEWAVDWWFDRWLERRRTP